MISTDRQSGILVDTILTNVVVLLSGRGEDRVLR